MEAYRIETTLERDGILTLSDLPFQAGAMVEVIVLAHPFAAETPNLPHPRKAGSAAGQIWMSADFDEPLDGLPNSMNQRGG